MSLKTTIDNYKYAEQLHELIDDVYNQFEEGGIPDLKMDTIINKTLNDIDRLKNLLNKINVNDLESNYSKSTIEDVEHNIHFYFEAAEHIEKKMYALKYYDKLLQSSENYISNVDVEKMSAREFTKVLLHSDNIMDFINHIKRIAVGTMSQNEFNKIYTQANERAGRKGDVVVGSRKAFESFQSYIKKYYL